jgi:hypothetical protein
MYVQNRQEDAHPGAGFAAQIQLGRRDCIVDQCDLAVSRRYDDADAVRRHPMGVTEERGARSGGRQTGATHPLAVAAQGSNTQRSEHKRQAGGMKRRNRMTNQIDDMSDPGGLRGSGGCGSACHRLL